MAVQTIRKNVQVGVPAAADPGDILRLESAVRHGEPHLLVHGTLHLLGYDHHDDREAEDMEAREVRALARLGIASPYQVTA